MTIVAHLSDLHLIERDHGKRRGVARQRLAWLSAGAPLDAEARMRRASACLQAARRAGAEHVLITGDLTEDGVDSQFDVLAEVLHGSGLDPEAITLVPGNHDAYASVAAFERAIQDGPLRAFAATSGKGACSVLPECVIAPVSTVIEGQLFTHARGVIHAEDVLAVRRLTSDPISRDRAVIVAQHHPPSHHALFAVGWFDGVKNAVAMRDLMLERNCVHVLHGHVHRKSTKHFSGRQDAQVYCTASVRDGDETGIPLRLYKAEDRTLRELVAAVSVPQPAAASLPERLRLAFMTALA